MMNEGGKIVLCKSNLQDESLEFLYQAGNGRIGFDSNQSAEKALEILLENCAAWDYKKNEIKLFSNASVRGSSVEFFNGLRHRTLPSWVITYGINIKSGKYLDCRDQLSSIPLLEEKKEVKTEILNILDSFDWIALWDAQHKAEVYTNDENAIIKLVSTAAQLSGSDLVMVDKIDMPQW